MSALTKILASARVSLSGTFIGMKPSGKDRFGETPKPTRGTRVLPGDLARATWL
jgi:hypothetical protein